MILFETFLRKKKQINHFDPLIHTFLVYPKVISIKGINMIWTSPIRRVLKFFKKRHALRRSSGISMLEVLIISVIIGAFAIASTLLITQSKLRMRSVSQTGSCPLLAKEILEQFTSFGTALYGYSYGDSSQGTSHNPKFRPLLLTTHSSGYKDVAGCTTCSGSIRSLLKFPSMLNEAFQRLSIVKDGQTNSIITAPSNGDWVNTGKDIIKVVKDSSGKKTIHLGSSIFLINQVNVLQFLYNKDHKFFDDNVIDGVAKGKKYSTMQANSPLQTYKERYGLDALDVYILIRPVDLKKSEVIKHDEKSKIKCGRYSGGSGGIAGTYREVACPTKSSHKLILTRPRFSNVIKGQIPGYVVVHGNPNIGFEIQITISYTRTVRGTGQDLSCQVAQIFTHQMDKFKKNEKPPDIQITSITNGAGTNMTGDNDGNDAVLTSCDTHGSGYNDISIELNFDVKTAEMGTLLVCRGVRGCRSGDSIDPYGSPQPPQNFSPVSCQYEVGDWTRCHDVQFPGQTQSTVAELKTNNQLKLTFKGLANNKRYDLQVAELSTAGTLSQILIPTLSGGSNSNNNYRFYIDSSRPYIREVDLDKNVGKPGDKINDRDYSGDPIQWAKPGPLDSKGRWLQCNTADVEITSSVEDQLTHNLQGCSLSAKRQDGKGITSITKDLCDTYTFGNRTTSCRRKGDRGGVCPAYTGGTTPCKSGIRTGSGDTQCSSILREIAHGRQIAKLTPSDSCGAGPTRTVVWDTDLPGTFKSKPFQDKKFRSTESPYVITAELPATGAGTFPRHWGIRCFEEGDHWPQAKKDGNGGNLSCQLVGSRSSVDDGCNPNTYGGKYFHVCGKKVEDQGCTWSVYAPLGKSCQNVDCEPELICCDGTLNDCGNAGGKGKCGSTVSNTDCGTPVDGSGQDLNSGCPPLGLYECNYVVNCEAGGRSETCSGRAGDSCTITWPCPTQQDPGRTCSASGTCKKTGGCSKKPSTSLTGACGKDKCLLRGPSINKCPTC